ncbi:methyltransferase [Microbacteriaceae bacterium VKM Ac-2855]|nr:methyltransferase [Microbacteriaceae bacterium VKM Ac-2855]
MREDVLQQLRRRPDVEAPDLVAVDAADRLLLDLAQERLSPGCRVAVIGDAYGALSLGLDVDGGIAVYQDSFVAERALDRNAAEFAPETRLTRADSVSEAAREAQLVLLRLPRSLDQLDAYAGAIAQAAPDAVLLAGGRLKHMSVSMNEVLLRHYERLDVSLARQKSRVLIASAARSGGSSAGLVTQRLDELDLVVCASPGVFGGAKLDIGARFLLEHLDAAALPGSRFVDLGCGTGLIATWLARARPDARVVATDTSWAATVSAAATATANGVAERVDVLRDDNAASLATGSVDVIVCNPPFHSDGAVTELVAQRMIRGAARVLRPGGEMWTVFNSHLSHPAVLRTAVGPTRVVARDRKFTVTRSVRRSE